MQRQPPPYPPPGARQPYPYPGQPFYAPQYGGQYVDMYPHYQYQQRPPPPDYARYAEHTYYQVHQPSHAPPPYQPLQTQHLPPKLKAAARPVAVQPVYQVAQPPPAPAPVRVQQSEVRPAPQAQYDCQYGTRVLDYSEPPPGFDIIGRGSLPSIHFDTSA